MATAYLSGIAACLAEALPDGGAQDLLATMRRSALIPVPELGYS